MNSLRPRLCLANQSPASLIAWANRSSVIATGAIPVRFAGWKHSIRLGVYRYKGDTELVERLHHAGEVEKRAAESIDLVDDHAINLAGLDVFHQSLERRPFDVATGEASVVVAIGYEFPALIGLAANVRLTSVALRIERIVLLIESFFGRLASIDRTANRSGPWCWFVAHAFLPSRKNINPLQCEPLTSLAIAVSDL